jgi:hypothetical protein
MRDETVKQRQERLMTECLAAEPRLRIRSWKRDDPPRTDITLELGSGEVVALEVRGLTDPDRQESISTRKRIGQLAEKLLEGRRVNAHVAWEPGIVIPPKETAPLAEEIVKAVIAMQRHGRKVLGEIDEVPERLRRFVATVRLFNPESDEPVVHTAFESWEGSGSTEVVQSALDEKEERLASYRRAHPESEVWLLLWTSSGESQPVTTEMLDPTHVYRSSFDRAFVVDYPRRAVMELELIPASD